jgi:hypothetical protein
MRSSAAIAASAAVAPTGNTRASVVVLASPSAQTTSPSAGSRPSRAAAVSTATPQSVLFPGFFTSSSTESAMHVQQAPPPLRSFDGSRDDVARRHARRRGGGGDQRHAVQEGARRDARAVRQVHVVQQAALAHDGLPAQVAVHEEASRAHPRAAAHPRRQEARADADAGCRAPDAVGADARHPRRSGGVHLLDVPRAERDARAGRGERREHVVVAHAVLQQLGHRADVHEARRHEREREQRATAHRLRQQLARAPKFGYGIFGFCGSLLVGGAFSFGAGTDRRDVVRPAEVARVRVLAHGLHQVAVRAHLDAGERARVRRRHGNQRRARVGAHVERAVRQDPFARAAPPVPREPGAGKHRAGGAHRRDGGFLQAPPARDGGERVGCVSFGRAAGVGVGVADDGDGGAHAGVQLFAFADEDAVTRAHLHGRGVRERQYTLPGARDGVRAEPRERAELHGDVGAADEDSVGQTRREFLERHELRLQHGRGDAHARGVERDLPERLAQRAVRRGTLAVPAGVQQEELLAAPPAPGDRLQAKHHVQGRASAAHSRAGGVGDDQVPLASTGELSPRVQRIQLLDVGLGLAVVRRGEHHRVPEPAIQRARAIAPGQQAAVLAEPLLGAAHHRALLRLASLEVRLRRRGKTHGGTGRSPRDARSGVVSGPNKQCFFSDDGRLMTRTQRTFLFLALREKDGRARPSSRTRSR